MIGVSIRFQSLFPHDVSIHFVYHSVSDIEAFRYLLNHNSCCFFIFGSDFICPGISRFSSRCSLRCDASIVSRLPVRIARRQLQDSPTTLEEGAKHSAFIAELFLNVNGKRKNEIAKRRRKRFSFHRRAIPQGKRKRPPAAFSYRKQDRPSKTRHGISTGKISILNGF
jgi:hypothetical protein